MESGHAAQGVKDAFDENVELLKEMKATSIDSTMEALMGFEEEILTSQPKHQDIVAEVLHGVSNQLARLEQVLGSLITQNVEPICRVSAQMAELRKENARFRAQLAVESDVVELRLENEQLRAHIASAGVSVVSSGTAGTGESSSARLEAVMTPSDTSDGTTGGSEIVKDNNAASVSPAASSSAAPPCLKERSKLQADASEPPDMVYGHGKWNAHDTTSQHVAPPTPVAPPVITLPRGSAPELEDERDSAEENTSHPLAVPYGNEDSMHVAADQSGGAETQRGSLPWQSGGSTGSACSLAMTSIAPSTPSSVSPSSRLRPQVKKAKSTRFSNASNPGIRVSHIPTLRISDLSTGSAGTPQGRPQSFQSHSFESHPSMASSKSYASSKDRLSRFQDHEEKKKRIKRGLLSATSHGSKASHVLHQRQSRISQAFQLLRGNAIRFSHSQGQEEQAEQAVMASRKGVQQDTMFADANEMKARLREAIGKPKYDVANFYKEAGVCQRIARAGWFENFTLFVIALNALWIAIDTEYNNKDVLIEAHPAFQIAENLFCIYFTMEWTIRFASFAEKCNCLRDGWFVFDSGLVAMMVSETWILSIVMLSTSSSGGGFGDASVVRLVKLLRLSRMARMAKLLVAMPELNILLKGIACAGRSVCFTLLLLSVILYIFGIAFTQLLVDTEAGEKYFPNLPISMLTLLLHGTFLEDLPKVVKMVGQVNFVYGAFLLLFVLIASLTVMNMLIGILCEVVSVVSAVEKESSLLQFVKTRMQEMLTQSGLDADGDGMITKSEFEKLIEIPEAARALQEVGVDVLGLVDSADFIFGMDGDVELTFVDFMDIVLQLRGSNNATVKDVVDLRKFFTQEMTILEEKVAHSVVMEARKISQGLSSHGLSSEHRGWAYDCETD